MSAVSFPRWAYRSKVKGGGVQFHLWPWWRLGLAWVWLQIALRRHG
jgi:hypothetical protein